MGQSWFINDHQRAPHAQAQLAVCQTEVDEGGVLRGQISSGRGSTHRHTYSNAHIYTHTHTVALAADNGVLKLCADCIRCNIEVINAQDISLNHRIDINTIEAVTTLWG